MQSLKKAALIGFALTLAMQASCKRFAAGSFDAAVEQAREDGVARYASAGAGLPYYALGSMDPIWPDGEQAIKRVQAPDFNLVDQDGQVFGRSRDEGKIRFIAFLFTSCAGVCPFLVTNLKKLAEKDSGSDLSFLGISVDTELDTPPKLKAYHTKMGLDARWRLLTGDRERIYGLIRDNFLSQAFRREDVAERNFAHSEHFYVIDQKGYLRAVLNGLRLDVWEEGLKVVEELRRESMRSSEAAPVGTKGPTQL